MTVAVCQDPGGVSIAAVETDSSGDPVLKFSDYIACNASTDCQQIVSQQVREHSVENARCVVVLPVDSYQQMHIEMPDLPDEERHEAVRWQIREQIDYPPEDAVVDLYDVAPFGSEKKPLTYVIAAQKQALEGHVKLVEKSDLALDTIDIPDFALRNICQLFKQDERGVAILLLLERNGLLAIVRDETLYLLRLLNSGMDHLIPFAEDDLEALTEQLDTIVLEVQRSLDFCESTFHLPQVSRLLVAQTQKNIPTFASYLDDSLTVNVEALSFDDVLRVPEDSDQIALNRHLLAIGGALRRDM